MKKEVKPFDMYKKPRTPYRTLTLVEWIGSLYFYAGAHGAKINYHDCKHLKPPYLLLMNHASMIDMAVAVKAAFPHRVNWVISIEEFVGREFLFRGVGGLYKRKFTDDLNVVRNIVDVLRKRKRICVMYPEARYSLAGVNEHMSDAIGKLVKIAKCPVAVVIEHGNFITQPQWNKSINHHVPVTADMRVIVTEEEVKTLSAEEIQKRIEEAFVYDDYQWQKDHNIRIKSKKRAVNLHKVLYQCPVCKKEFEMDTAGTEIFCKACNARWELSELGELHRLDSEEEVFTHVPDWYRWEREQVRAEVRSGAYRFEDTVRLEHLDNCRKGFRKIGYVTLTQDENGFTMNGKLDNGEDFTFNRPCLTMESVHIEYDFKKKGTTERGAALDLATLTDTYFVFPENKPQWLTKIHFATEELYSFLREKQEDKE